MRITIGNILLAGTLFALALGTVTPTYGESEECDQLPQARQAMCWMVLSCTAIEEPAKRQECFLAAYEGFRSDTGRQGAAAVLEPSTPEPVTAPVAPPRSADVPADVPAEATTEPAAVSTTVPTPSASADVAVDPEPPASKFEVATTTRALDIPDDFTATITYQKTLLRDRQIFVLDNALVFEGDEARVSRLEVGQEVAVERTSRLFKDRFSVTGPSKRPVAGKRLPCESTDLTADTAEKCELRKR